MTAAPSWRTTPLPRGWARIRARALARDGHRCTARDSTGERCTERTALEVDHITPAHLGGSDDLDNLRTLCRWHHARVTSAQARAARAPRPSRYRDGEAHPGAIR